MIVLDGQDVVPTPQAARSAVARTLAVLQNLSARRNPPRLWVMWRGDDPLAAAGVCGLLRAAAFEHPDLLPSALEVAAATPLESVLPDLLADPPAITEIAWRHGVRAVARVKAGGAPDTVTGLPHPVREGAAYVVTGGLGGLGLLTVRRLAERGAGRVVACGRRKPAEPAAEVVERDLLPDEPVTRRGVPQATHVHALAVRGQMDMDALLPGFTADLAARGFLVGDFATEVAIHNSHGWARRFPSNLRAYGLSRTHLEWLLRRRVLAHPRVELRQRHSVQGLRLRDQTVETVLAKETGSDTVTELPADLVVDATGRSSRIDHWLHEADLPTPPVTIVSSGLGYASRQYRPPDRNMGGTARSIEKMSPYSTPSTSSTKIVMNTGTSVSSRISTTSGLDVTCVHHHRLIHEPSSSVRNNSAARSRACADAAADHSATTRSLPAVGRSLRIRLPFESPRQLRGRGSRSGSLRPRLCPAR
ncbi:KR domain-containing protein [Actinomadura decatromicini]|uniref:KR domain-containing protein n=1 Tax=Actinomadura decatromicini TaxID=2604572 RepID=UPI0016530CC5|nr:KR domain-containing protein [Actinomadura decatromicini]